jgi:hypothetical protein
VATGRARLAVTDARRRAYATLGLPSGASERAVRKRYRALVRRWHPDRFARDPRSQAEAAERMRAINQAYELLKEPPAPGDPLPDVWDPEAVNADARTSAAGPAGGRLSREQLDELVERYRVTGPLDALFRALDGLLERLRPVAWKVFLFALAVRLGNAAARSDFDLASRPWELTSWVSAVVLLAILEHHHRRGA